MLVCMEIQNTNPEELPGPLRTEVLAHTIQPHAKHISRAAMLTRASQPRMSKLPSESSLDRTKLATDGSA